MPTPITEQQISEQILAPLNLKIAETSKALQDQLAKTGEDRDTQLADKIDRELESMRAEMKSELAKAEARYSLPGSEDTGDEKADFSLSRAARAITTGNWSRAGRELETFKAMEAKAGDDARVPWDSKEISVGVDTGAGFLVPNENVRPMIELLRSRTVTMKLGAREINVVGSPVMIPKQTGLTTATWVGEGSAIPASDIGIGQIEGRPRTLAAYSEMTNLLLELSQPAADAVIRDDFAAQLSRGLDLGALMGTGAGGQPLGIVNTTDVNIVTLGANPTYAQLADYPQQLRLADAFMGRMGWAMSPEFYGAVETIDDEALPGHALMRRLLSVHSGGMLGGGAGLENAPSNAPSTMTELLGYTVETSTQMESTVDSPGSAIFGNWEDLIFLAWGGMQLAASGEAGSVFQSDKTAIRGLCRRDVIVRNPESFCVTA